MEILTCDGEPECVVLSQETYDRMARAEAYQESVRLGRIALEQERLGLGRPLEDFIAEVEQRLGIKVGAGTGR